jgi:hypothetical protein
MLVGAATWCTVVVAASALAVAGCGGSSSNSSTGGPLIARTLAPVAATSTPGADFEFGDLAAERQLAARGPAWATLTGVGASYFANADPNGTRDGLNIASGNVGLVIGVPPHVAATISGPQVDGAKVKAAVVKLGATPATVLGRPGVVWGAEGAFHLSAVNAFGIGPGEGQFDRAVIEPHAVYAARFTTDLQRLFGGSHTLGADPVTQATVNCLGDVIAALGVAGQGQGGSELAAGVLRSSGAGVPHEVLCEVPPAVNVAATEQLVRSLYGPHPPKLPQGADLKADASSATVSTGSAGGRTWIRAVVVDKPPVGAGYLIQTVERNILQP